MSIFVKPIFNVYFFDADTKDCVFFTAAPNWEAFDKMQKNGYNRVYKSYADLSGRFAIAAASVDDAVILKDICTGQVLDIEQAKNIDIRYVGISLTN